MKNPALFFCYFFEISVCIIFLLHVSCSSHGITSSDKNDIDTLIKTEKLSERVLIARLGWDAVTAVATQKGIVVIDGGISNSITEEFKKCIEREFKRKDFAYLINTHSHPDHVGGNQVFSETVIIGHDNCLGEMIEYRGKIEEIKPRLLKTAEDYNNQLKTLDHKSDDWHAALLQRCRYQQAYNDLLADRVVTIPSLTFNDKLSLNMGDISLLLIYFGNAHSESDIIIFIPEEKLLMTGDLFSPGGRLWFDKDKKLDPERWKKVLEWIASHNDQINLVIGGHGEIMSKTDLGSFIINMQEKIIKMELNE